MAQILNLKIVKLARGIVILFQKWGLTFLEISRLQKFVNLACTYFLTFETFLHFYSSPKTWKRLGFETLESKQNKSQYL